MKETPADLLDKLEAISRLADANFPSETHVTVAVAGTGGGTASGQIRFASYRLAEIVRLARLALAETERK